MKLEDLADETCAWCGKGYEARSVWQKYCCAGCRAASISAFHKQEVRTKLAKLTCQHCGAPIVGAKKTDTKFCCIPCRTAARTLREKGPLSAVRCIDCGGPIRGVTRRDTKRCAECARLEHRRRAKERAKAKRQRDDGGSSVKRPIEA
ncbi:hypothetical protein [Consotaella salsifontis]|uniref:Uncharacterized protein n=1 Tax=Consotaella salsifontis TaxID=1365950 RepID=A0A1T4SKR9_9HYPH|nr:hypothetical protein [Consotaella salsifontis]SKA28518.1 hypothetical protein SAMN05428963_11187 [Consotaella salsifontis]